jgi:hypothetical protein
LSGNVLVMSANRPRLGRPVGPTVGRGPRPWDRFDKEILDSVAANPKTPRYLIAAEFGISPDKLSCITCSPKGVAYLEQLRRFDNEK